MKLSIGRYTVVSVLYLCVQVIPIRVLSQVPSGPLVWLRADKGVVIANGHVSKWLDQSGNENDAVMSEASHQPLFAASTVNGQPAIVFDGGAYLQCPNVFPTLHDYTICTVVKFDDGNPNNIISGDDHALFMYWDRTPRVLHHDAFATRTSRIPMWEEGFSCLLVPYSQFTQQATIYVNGQPGVTGYLGPTSDSILYLGCYQKSFFLKGEIQEVIIYDRLLSDQDRRQVQGDLMSRYQIALAPPLPKPDSTFTNLPRPFQLCPRDADDSATVVIAGNIYAPNYDSIFCIQFKNGLQIAGF